MSDGALLAQLKSIRASAAAIVAQADAIIGLAAEESKAPPAKCPPHPERSVVDVSTMGDPRQRCVECGADWVRED